MTSSATGRKMDCRQGGVDGNNQNEQNYWLDKDVGSEEVKVTGFNV